MVKNLTIELIAQQDHVLAVAWQKPFQAAAGVPDSGLGHEIESSAVNDRRALELCFCSEEDGRPKDPLKGCDQPAVLRTTLLKPKGIQHLGGAAEGDPWRSLSNCYGSQEDREKAVLPPR